MCAFNMPFSVLSADYCVFIAGAGIGAGADIAADEIFHFVAVEVARAGVALILVVILVVYAVLAAGGLLFVCHGCLLFCSQGFDRVFSCCHL